MAERAAKQLELNKSELPNSITEVIATLSRAGFDAYIVGGGVRDTLLGLKPKDFDAVTDAKPHEIKDVFGKRCRIIGRRFQLAHVYSGRELIEVATFRGPPNNDASTNQDGMILRDNVWGDIKQDFARRDFSINALYYQPLKGVVHDFCGALDDIENKTIRLLGHAPVRIEEDPVRLLRALRFKAKLGFEFDQELSDQFHDDNWALLEQISPHRLYDETQKMFTGGYLVPLLPLLFESGAIDSLIIYPPAEPSSLVQQVAINTDKRIGAGKSINPAFFYAALLWENYLHQLEKAKKRNMPFAEAQMQAAGKVIDRQRIKTAIPKFAEQFIRDIWLLQPKLAAPRSKQIEILSEHPRFRAGFDFLLLREQCGDAEHPLSESTNEMGEWWQNYQTLSESQKQQEIEDFDENIRRGAYKREPRGRGRNRQNQSDISPQKTEQPLNNEHAKVPERRRRASEQPATIKANNDNSSKNKADKRTLQAKHDSNELAQLQQLSLANVSVDDNSRGHSSNKGSTSSAKPLFVIEHGNVVPPLKRELPTNRRQSVKSPKVSIVDQAEYKTRQSDHSELQDQTVNNDKAEQVNKPPTKAKPALNNPKASKVASTKSQIAQTPKLVTTNDEPIPNKRRRRQQTVASQSSTDNQSAQNHDYKDSKATETSKAKEGSPVKAKAPVVKKSATTKSAVSKASAAKDEVVAKPKKMLKADSHANSTSKMPANKGAVPAKRRRRQPSTDTVVTE